MKTVIECLFASLLLSVFAYSNVSSDTGAIPEPFPSEATRQGADSPNENKLRAIATIEPKSGSNLQGEAFFVLEGDEVNFGIHIANASPGAHAVHLHELGDCSAPDASSAGDHWNPTNEAHGKWGDNPFHLGDIGNIEVGEDGDGTLTLTTDLWTMNGSGHSVLNKAVVVHATADDFSTQPDGAAGERVGCGVVKWKHES